MIVLPLRTDIHAEIGKFLFSDFNMVFQHTPSYDCLTF